MTTLKKELGLFDATVYGIGIILGAGIYALIGEATAITGNSLWISFIIGAFIALCTGLSYSELATMYPKAGAEYVYISKGLSNKLLAFLIGWIIILTGATTAATVALGFAGYFNELFKIPKAMTAAVLIVLMSYLNYLGIKQSSRLNIVFTAIEVLGLLLVIGLALTHVGGQADINYFQMNDGFRGILASAALVFFAYIGFEDIANIAEEVKNPKKVLAKAFILSVVITTILYICTSIAALSLMPAEELGNSPAPLATAVSKTFLSTNAFTVMSLIALFATANTVLIVMIVGSRMLYGMAKKSSLPNFLAAIHTKRGTPYNAILIFMIGSLFFLFVGNIGFIANVTSQGAFITFALINASLIALRLKKPNTHRPFKSPINIGGMPILAILGLLTSIFMTFQFSFSVTLLTIVIIAFGMLFYFFVIRK